MGFGHWLQTLNEGAHGNADLVAYFFRRAFSLVREGAGFGFVATNTIGQGDTRATGLMKILTSGGAIVRATRRLRWPGELAVVVSVVHIIRGSLAVAQLAGRPVRRISASFVEGNLDDEPARLSANFGKAFSGSYVLGMGFTFDDELAERGIASPIESIKELVQRNNKNAECIFPYVGGDDLNRDPRQSHRRYVIDFADLDEKTARRRYPELLAILERLARPQRLADNREGYRKYWWRFAERRTPLLRGIEKLPRIIVAARVSPHLNLVMRDRGPVFNKKQSSLRSKNTLLFVCLRRVYTRYGCGFYHSH